MTTEKQIVYSILNTIRGGKTDNDEVISTRLVRSWIASERSNLLLNFTDNGRTTSDVLFQDLGDISFTKVSTNIYKATLPRVILLGRNTGIKISYNGEVVGMISQSQNHGYEKDYMIKNIKRAWNIGNDFYARIESSENNISLNIQAVLFYPGDSPSYDWENDYYPISPELLNPLKQQVLQKEQLIIDPRLQDRTNNLTSDAGEQVSQT